MRITVLFIAIFMVMSQIAFAVYAPVTDKRGASSGKSDEGVWTAIKADEAKIAEEREAIIAASRRLKEIRNAGDKAAYEQAKVEVSKEIADRKATIKRLYNDIYKKSGSSNQFYENRREKIKDH